MFVLVGKSFEFSSILSDMRDFLAAAGEDGPYEESEKHYSDEVEHDIIVELVHCFIKCDHHFIIGMEVDLGIFCHAIFPSAALT